ncbi:unnamed protein product [Ophioblennius macclurei]
MEKYDYALFFEARAMSEKEKEKVRRHFQKKRESGGGECGVITHLSGNSYEISFKNKEDQERVLQRKFHTISLPDGEVQLIVSRINPTETRDPPPTVRPQTFRRTNTKSLEKIFRPDLFLLFFLRDSPKALTYLQKQLSAIGCQLELRCDQEEAVVRGDVDKGPGGAFGGFAEKWERRVDRVMVDFTENYACHHLVEARQVRALLQDVSFVDEDLKVYMDSGYPVLVGRAEAVKEKMAALTESLPSRREKPITEKQLRLIVEEFSGEMREHYPLVQVIRGTGVLVLEGLDEEVLSAAATLDKLVDNIKHRQIQFPTPLLNFINMSGAISKYQERFEHNRRTPVLIEMGPDLVLSSLSADALDEVQAALVKDLTISTMQLQGPAAVPPDLDGLKDVLSRAQREANRDDLRVEVSLIPGIHGANKVRLVGYSTQVLHLKAIVQDYQMNKVTSQDAVNLPNPKFADHLDKILDLTGVQPAGVTLQVSHSPNNPHVILSGPHCKVQEAKQALTSALSSLTSDTLVLEGPGAQRYFQTDGKDSKDLVERSFRVVIMEQQSEACPDVRSKQRSSSSPVKLSSRLPHFRIPSGSVGGTANATNKADMSVKLGSLEDQQVNVLVVPMVNKQLTSTQVGIFLLRKAGNVLKSTFDSLAPNNTVAPGDVLQVDGPPTLGCSKIFFIECLPWDGVRGTSVQALGKGLRRCLDLCARHCLVSVAFPVIGPGKLLKYPVSEAVRVLADAICGPGCGSVATVHIVIKPGHPDSEKAYHDLHQNLSMRQAGEAVFRSLTTDLDDVAVTLGGGVKLRMVFGDIADETTDVVVNTTDFTNFDYDGVCRRILAIAGKAVENELQEATINKGSTVWTRPGRFPCKAILHVCGEKTAAHVEELAQLIISSCDAKGYSSVAVPALCTGVGGLQPGVVAAAILRGIRTATAATRLRSLRHIRIILNNTDVFLAFHEEAGQMFSFAAGRTNAPPTTQHQEPQLSASADLLSDLSLGAVKLRSGFLFLGLSRKSVDDAVAKLKGLYQHQCSAHTFRGEELEGLTQVDVTHLKQLVETHGLHLQADPSGGVTVSGQKDGVTQAVLAINAVLQGHLRREVRVREEEELYARVVWCITNCNGLWERLPKTANYNLEKRDFANGIVDAHGAAWTVSPTRTDATNVAVAEPRKLKRLENLSDFTVPLSWDSMAPGEDLKVVTVAPSSKEYRTLTSLFRRSAANTVIKIERLQNVHLRRAYEAQKKSISDKNLQEGEGPGEEVLFHGTTRDNCDAIMKTGFNRRFAGQNGTAFGAGVYFAVNAVYSAHPRYSKPAADGSQVMFAARVLTGAFTQGHSNMNVPPQRDGRRPHERFDSVVDRTDQPTVFVVFHDNQAYPDYLITFR